MPNINIQTVGNNGFPKAQVGPFYYAVNFWGVDLSRNDASGSWTVPAGTMNNAECYDLPVEGSADDTGACTMCWRIRDEVFFNGGSVGPGDTSRVFAYPFILFGSLGGRKEAWGVPCGTTTVLPGGNSARCGDDAYDMRIPNAAIGLPERVDNIGDLSFCFDIDKGCSGQTDNIENVFIDTYLHRIDNSNLWPTGYDNSWGDLNKINENATETWNINFKLCIPEFAVNNPDPGATATGGVRINTTPISIGGKDWAVYLKWENIGGGQARDLTSGLPGNSVANKCQNSFFYISFVPWGSHLPGGEGVCDQDNYCIDYKAHLDWVGSQEFKDRVLGINGQPQVGADRQNSGFQNHWPSWLYTQVGEPPFVVDEPQSYVLDGIMLGNELWFSETDEEACVCWENVSFTTDRGTFGKTTNVEPPPSEQATASCIAIVTEEAMPCECDGVPSTASGTCGEPLNINITLPDQALLSDVTIDQTAINIVSFSNSLIVLSADCTADISGNLSIEYSLGGFPCFCNIAVSMSGNVNGCTNEPVLSGCPARALREGETITMSVAGCCADADIQWQADSNNITFGSPTSTTTTVTASVAGNYRITATCS